LKKRKKRKLTWKTEERKLTWKTKAYRHLSFNLIVK